MRKRLIFSTAVLACAGVVAMLADGTTVGASGAVPVQSAHRMPSGTDVDPVLEWNQILNDTALASVPAPNSLVTSRSAALVAAAVFDAVNGIDRLVQAAPRHGPCTVTHVGTSCCDPSVVRDVDQAVPSPVRPFDDAP